MRAYIFRFAPESGRCPAAQAFPKPGTPSAHYENGRMRITVVGSPFFSRYARLPRGGGLRAIRDEKNFSPHYKEGTVFPDSVGSIKHVLFGFGAIEKVKIYKAGTLSR